MLKLIHWKFNHNNEILLLFSSDIAIFRYITYSSLDKYRFINYLFSVNVSIDKHWFLLDLIIKISFKKKRIFLLITVQCSSYYCSIVIFSIKT